MYYLRKIQQNEHNIKGVQIQDYFLAGDYIAEDQADTQLKQGIVYCDSFNRANTQSQNGLLYSSVSSGSGFLSVDTTQQQGQYLSEVPDNKCITFTSPNLAFKKNNFSWHFQIKFRGSRSSSVMLLPGKTANALQLNYNDSNKTITIQPANITYTVKLDTWYDIVVLRESNIFKLYVDGSLVAQAQKQANFDGDTFFIGAYYIQYNKYYIAQCTKFSLKNMQIWSRCLATQQINRLYVQPVLQYSDFKKQGVLLPVTKTVVKTNQSKNVDIDKDIYLLGQSLPVIGQSCVSARDSIIKNPILDLYSLTTQLPTIDRAGNAVTYTNCSIYNIDDTVCFKGIAITTLQYSQSTSCTIGFNIYRPETGYSNFFLTCLSSQYPTESDYNSVSWIRGKFADSGNNTVLTFYMQYNSSGYPDINFNCTISKKSWHNIIITIDKTIGATLYVDGQKKAALQSVKRLSKLKNPSIGGYNLSDYGQSSVAQIYYNSFFIIPRVISDAERSSLVGNSIQKLYADKYGHTTTFRLVSDGQVKADGALFKPLTKTNAQLTQFIQANLWTCCFFIDISGTYQLFPEIYCTKDSTGNLQLYTYTQAIKTILKIISNDQKAGFVLRSINKYQLQLVLLYSDHIQSVKILQTQAVIRNYKAKGLYAKVLQSVEPDSTYYDIYYPSLHIRALTNAQLYQLWARFYNSRAYTPKISASSMQDYLFNIDVKTTGQDIREKFPNSIFQISDVISYRNIQALLIDNQSYITLNGVNLNWPGITLNIRIAPQAVKGNSRFFSINGSFDFGYTKEGQLYFSYYGMSTITINTFVYISFNMWSFITLQIMKTQTAIIYINGVQVYSGQLSGIPITSLLSNKASVLIARPQSQNDYNTNFKFIGYMTDISVYPRVLSTVQVSQLCSQKQLYPDRIFLSTYHTTAHPKKNTLGVVLTGDTDLIVTDIQSALLYNKKYNKQIDNYLSYDRPSNIFTLKNIDAERWTMTGWLKPYNQTPQYMPVFKGSGVTEGLILDIPLASKDNIVNKGTLLQAFNDPQYTIKHGVPCAHFSGAQDVIIGCDQLPNAKQAVSVSLWMLSQNTDRSSFAFLYGTRLVGQLGLCPFQRTSDWIKPLISSCGNQFYLGPGRSSTWLHVVMTRQDNQLKTYVDGQLKQTNTCSNIVGITDKFNIGSKGPQWYSQQTSSYNIFFKGYLANIKVYKRVLLQSQIKALYSQLPPSPFIPCTTAFGMYTQMPDYKYGLNKCQYYAAAGITEKNTIGLSCISKNWAQRNAFLYGINRDTDTWHFLSLVNQSKYLKFYIDDIPYGHTGTMPAKSATFFIGGYPNKDNLTFSGQLSDIRIYKRALDRAAVTKLYQRGIEKV